MVEARRAILNTKSTQSAARKSTSPKPKRKPIVNTRPAKPKFPFEFQTAEQRTKALTVP